MIGGGWCGVGERNQLVWLILLFEFICLLFRGILNFII